MKLAALAEAIAIFARVDPDESFVAAEHDTIWVSDVPPAKLTSNELERIGALGFIWEDGCGWRHSYLADPTHVCGLCGKTFQITKDDPHWLTGRGPICP